MMYEAIINERHGAKIKDTVCVNIAVFDTLETMADMGYIPLKEGYGIGDIYANGEWVKSKPFPPDPEPEPGSEDVMTLKEITAFIKGLEEGVE